MIKIKLFNKEEIKLLKEQVEKLEFTDGKITAGQAAGVKTNLIAVRGTHEASKLQDIIAQKLVSNKEFMNWAHPKAIIDIIFAKYKAGQAYGWHVDIPMMNATRTDLSFTLFLNDDTDYTGGYLVIDINGKNVSYNLSAGDVIVYPSTYLHKVEEVLTETRLVAVGWIRSYIQNEEQRMLLNDLETARDNIFKTQGKTKEFDLITKASYNLMRMWADD